MRYLISVIWILSGVFLISLGCKSYWAYSTPMTAWLGMIPEFFALGHLWLGAHSVSIGLALFKTPSKATLYLRKFFLVLVVFIVTMFVQEFLIYGQWIANDFLKDELFLLLYILLIIACVKHFHFQMPVRFLGKDGFLDRKAAVICLAFVISVIGLPLILPYRTLEFLH